MAKKRVKRRKPSEGSLQQHQREHKLDQFCYYAATLSLIMLNIFGTFAIVPFFLLYNDVTLGIAVFVFGLAFGALFNLIILGIDHMKTKHHVTAWLVMPLLALVDLFLIYMIIQALNRVLQINISYDTITLGILFVVAFMLPYFVYIVSGRHKVVHP